MFHYVYKISNIKENKHYIGVRTSKKEPELDLGIIYFSSSKDKDFITDQKKNPGNYSYKVIKICRSREEALGEEILLHEILNVAENPNFYNKSKQTSEGFDTTGVLFVNGKKISSLEYKKQNFVKYHSYKRVSVKDKNGKTYSVPTDDVRYLSGELEHVSKDVVTAIDTNGNKKILTKHEYYSGNYTCNNTGKVPVRDKNGKCFLVERNSTLIKNGELCHVSTGMVSVKNIETGETLSVTKKEFLSNKKYVGVNGGVISGKDNPNAKTINIFDKNGKLKYTCQGNFKYVCRENLLPFTPLRKSYENGGTPIFITKRHLAYATKNNLLKYIGWYAKIV